MIIPKSPLDSKSVAMHYNELDSFYRQIWGNHLHHGLWHTGSETTQEAVKNLIRFVAGLAELKPEMSLCDVGCGYGETARMLADENNIHVTALTLSQAQYAYANSIPSDSNNPMYILCDWLENSLQSHQFDTVISIESSEHMVDKPQFFKEAFRVLRPQGKLVICAWLSKDDPNKVETKYLLEPICREGCMPSMGSVEDYRQWMEKEGFQNIQYTDLTKKVKKTWSLCGKGVLKALYTNQEFRKFMFNPKSKNRIFFLTVFRIWLAYNFGSMQYGVFVGDKG